jgi:hypothetical protein
MRDQMMTTQTVQNSVSSKQRRPRLRFKAFVNLDNELTWINWMCAEGYKPTQITFGCFYRFVPCAPGEYICETACMVNSKGRVDKERREQMEELLASDGYDLVRQKINGQPRYLIYTMRPTASSAPGIYTDLDSQIGEYRARLKFLKLWALISAAAMIAGVCLGLGSQVVETIVLGDLPTGAKLEQFLSTRVIVMFISIFVLGLILLAGTMPPIISCRLKLRTLQEQRTTFE